MVTRVVTRAKPLELFMGEMHQALPPAPALQQESLVYVGPGQFRPTDTVRTLAACATRSRRRRNSWAVINLPMIAFAA